MHQHTNARYIPQYLFDGFAIRNNECFSSSGYGNDSILMSIVDEAVTHSDSVDGHYSMAFCNNGQVFLCQDYYGQKQIYYTILDGEAYFASDIRYILCVDNVNILPSTEFLAHEIDPLTAFSDATPEHLTAYENIFKLPPRCFATYNNCRKNFLIVKYSDIVIKNEHHKSFTDSVCELEHRLVNFIKPLQDISPTGTKNLFDVSGGIDSAVVLAAAISGGSSDRIKAISCISNETGDNYYMDDSYLVYDYVNAHSLSYDFLSSTDLESSQESDNYIFLGPKKLAN